jgi:hypothetical protein
MMSCNDDRVLQVLPEQVELKPQGQAAIRVAFRPPMDGQFFCQPLRLVAFVKSMRSFRLVAEQHIVPPWNLQILVRRTPAAARTIVLDVLVGCWDPSNSRSAGVEMKRQSASECHILR